MNIDICFSPVLYSKYTYDQKERIVVVVDIFRATTTMCTAIANGAKSIIPVRTLEEAKVYKEKGYLVGGERNVKKFDFGDFGNTPTEYSAELIKGKDIVISTTNGTRAIDEASDCYCLVIGSFSNLSSVADFCIGQEKDVLVLCAGWQEKFNIEDSLFGGALAEILGNTGYNTSFDAAQVALSMWKEAKPDIWNYIQRSEHIKRLEANDLSDVAKYCLELNLFEVLPVYNKDTKKITNYK
ncbi:MAG: 2-phosphosulfolactate phosphatase [Dysgonomonas sp.]